MATIEFVDYDCAVSPRQALKMAICRYFLEAL